MKRRDFLKLIGAASLAPSVLKVEDAVSWELNNVDYLMKMNIVPDEHTIHLYLHAHFCDKYASNTLRTF